MFSQHGAVTLELEGNTRQFQDENFKAGSFGSKTTATLREKTGESVNCHEPNPAVAKLYGRKSTTPRPGKALLETSCSRPRSLR